MSAASPVYIGSIVNQNRVRRLERLTFLRALEAEVSILQEKLIAWNDHLREVIDDEIPCPREGWWNISDRDMLIFTSNTSKIGLFDHKLASALIHFYHDAHVARVRLADWDKLDLVEQMSGISTRRTRDAVMQAVTSSLSVWDTLNAMLYTWDRQLRDGVINTWLRWRKHFQGANDAT